jgi:lysozyme
MNVNALRTQLLDDEALRLKPYTDTKGQVTIGVGHNLTARGISHAQAMQWLDEDIAETIAAVEHAWPWVARLDNVRQHVLFNMAFNLGTLKLGTFHRFLDALQQGNYQAAAVEMIDSDWASDVGKRATRLATEMLTGEVKP